jgi:hypothetical protein
MTELIHVVVVKDVGERKNLVERSVIRSIIESIDECYSRLVSYLVFLSC